MFNCTECLTDLAILRKKVHKITDPEDIWAQTQKEGWRGAGITPDTWFGDQSTGLGSQKGAGYNLGVESLESGSAAFWASVIITIELLKTATCENPPHISRTYIQVHAYEGIQLCAQPVHSLLFLL